MAFRTILCITAALCLGAAAPLAARSPGETVVFIRHGEKPPGGLGQLSCQGLNRALALPAVIAREFGVPDAFIAPDPASPKSDHGRDYDYVRPLATIEPTAIAAGRPVDASIGYRDATGLARLLLAPERRASVVVVAWEHTQIVDVARLLLQSRGGKPADVPDWNHDDYDSIYIVRLPPDGPATFAQDHEGLNDQPKDCPH